MFYPKSSSKLKLEKCLSLTPNSISF